MEIITLTEQMKQDLRREGLRIKSEPSYKSKKEKEKDPWQMIEESLCRTIKQEK